MLTIKSYLQLIRLEKRKNYNNNNVNIDNVNNNNDNNNNDDYYDDLFTYQDI